MKKAIALALSLSLSLSLLTGCAKTQTPVDPETPAVTTPADPDLSPEDIQPTDPDDVSPTPSVQMDMDPLNLVVLAGPTGVGAAKLMTDADAGTTVVPYNITVEADNQVVTALLTTGEADIAAIATNVAATLYNLKSDSITVLAVNTLGVLYILEKGEPTVTTFSDLKGKTIWTTGQGANPEYTLNYLLEQNGLTPGQDVTIEFMTATEVSAKMISSDEGICMLPVPASTALMIQDSDVTEVLNLDAEWTDLTGTALTMGCIAVRNDYLAEHPDAVSNFLAEYEDSIGFIADEENRAEAAQMVANYGITPSAAIATQAIPKCGLTYLTGSAMQQSLQAYYEMLFQANAASIGSGMPYDDFYYNP